MAPKPLGRRIPTDFDHVAKYPLSALIADPADALVVPPSGVEKGLGLPYWWATFDQGSEGSCVGFGCTSMMSITNARQYYVMTGKAQTFRFMPRWLYNEAQLVDEWAETPPEEGTSVRAGCDILRTVGHRRVVNTIGKPPDIQWGIAANRWAQTHDEVRAAIYANLAVAIGVNWYSNFDNPITYNNELYIGRKANLGSIRGGHCVTLYRMSDSRQAFRLMNSWGDYYPPVWLPYDVLDRLITEDGEVAVITDR